MSKKTIKDENGKTYTVKEKKPFYKKWWFWLIIAIIAIAAFGGSESDSSSSDSSAKTEQKSSDAKTDENSEKTSKEETGQAVTLGAGEYTVGDQIKPGRYVIKAASGSGNLTSESGDINVILGQQVDNDMGQVDSYTTNLKKGTKIKISGINQTSFTPVTSREYLTQLTAGQWVVGKDIKPGRYKVVATAGSGNFSSTNGDINEILGTSEDSDAGQVTSVTVQLHNGEVINSTLQGVKLQAE
ncbi:hypothetical protein ACWCL1_05125 [Ligilactobacillus sp. LYQ135]